jgi:hypothetical protein
MYEQFSRHTADLVSLQNRWEHAAQLRGQSAYEYYAFLLKLQSSIAAVNWECRPSDISLVTKYAAFGRGDLQRYLQEKRIDHPGFSIHQLVQEASVRESPARESSSRTASRLDTMNGGGPRRDNHQKYCFFRNLTVIQLLTVAKLQLEKRRVNERSALAPIPSRSLRSGGMQS